MTRHLTCCLALSLWFIALGAQAMTFRVAVFACDAEPVEAEEIARILSLETIHNVKESEAPIAINVACEDGGASIEVIFEKNQKTVKRSITDAVENRVIALSAATLIVSLQQSDGITSPEKKNVEHKSIKRTDTHHQIDREKPWLLPEQQAVPTGRRVVLGLAGGVRGRANVSIFTSTPAIFGQVVLAGRLGLRLVGAFEAGRTQTTLGEVRLIGGFGGGALFVRLFSRKHVALLGSVGALIGGVTLKGRSSARAGGSKLTGVGADAYLSVSPTISTNRFEAALDLKGGYGLKNPIGHIEGKAITLGGFWIGADIRIGFGWNAVHGR